MAVNNGKEQLYKEWVNSEGLVASKGDTEMGYDKGL